MATIVRSSTARLAQADVPVISGLTAGEALTACAPCTIDSNGDVVMSGSAIDVTQNQVKIVGWTGRAYANDDPVTLFVGAGIRFNYSSGMTPGSFLYSGSLPGMLQHYPVTFNSDVITGTGSLVVKNYDKPAVVVVSATDVVTLR